MRVNEALPGREHTLWPSLIIHVVSHQHDYGHSHAQADASEGRLKVALALLSDAAHMLTDAGALALALVAIRLARRPARGAMTYGLGRSEILSAQFNGATLLILGLLIVYEGVRRLIDPPAVQGGVVL